MTGDQETRKSQDVVCQRLNISPLYPDLSLKIGLAIQTKGKNPTTGMRASPENGTEGWYIWSGEYSEDPDFFKPIHIHHLLEVWPEIIPYLALPPAIDLSSTTKGTKMCGMSLWLLSNNFLIHCNIGSIKKFIAVRAIRRLTWPSFQIARIGQPLFFV